MIKKTFIIFIILFVGLNVWLTYWDGMKPMEHAGVYIRNNIRHEKFILSEVHYDTVLVGSSMAARLNLDSIFDESINITSEGGSFSSGLSFIKMRDKLPSLALLEVNAFVRFDLDIITKPYEITALNTIKSKVPLLQSKYRLACNTVHNSLPAFEKVLLNLPKEGVVAKKKEISNEPFYISRISEENYGKNIEEINDFIQFASNNNIQVLLVEMPFEKGIQDPLFRKAREMAKQYATQDHIHYIESDSFNEMVLTDHVHLSAKSATSFSVWLNKKLEEINL
jgi:hypothetical protein